MNKQELFWKTLCPKCKRVWNIECWMGVIFTNVGTKKSPVWQDTGRRYRLPLWTKDLDRYSPAQVLPQCVCGHYLQELDVLNRKTGPVVEPKAA